MSDGWIKCSERMPEDGQKVFHYVQWLDDVRRSTYNSKLGRFPFSGLDSGDGPNVTYWMPRNDELPAPPEDL